MKKWRFTNLISQTPNVAFTQANGMSNWTFPDLLYVRTAVYKEMVYKAYTVVWMCWCEVLWPPLWMTAKQHKFSKVWDQCIALQKAPQLQWIDTVDLLVLISTIISDSNSERPPLVLNVGHIVKLLFSYNTISTTQIRFYELVIKVHLSLRSCFNRCCW